MCLLIAKTTLEGLLLGFNRDDNPKRTHEKIYEDNQIKYPIDKTAKGTWIGLNKQTNQVYALLNHTGTTPQNPKTRGEIIPKLLENPKQPIINPRQYAPFQLFQYNYETKEIKITLWDGQQIKTLKPDQTKPIILASSSYGVAKQRKKYTQKLLAETTTLNQNNLQQILNFDNNFPSLITPKMKGSKSQTISTSIIQIQKNKQKFQIN